MKVLFVSYDHPFTGHSGVSVYSRDLFQALVEREIVVDAMYIHHRGWRGVPTVRVSQERGITLLAVTNSPLHPETSLYHPEQDIHQASLARLLRSCLEARRPDVLHVQTLQGFPGSLLSTARELAIPTVVMLHDFWAICPRMLLMRTHGESCDGPDGGRNCVQFCVQPRSIRQKIFEFGMRLRNGRLKKAFLTARSVYVRTNPRPGSLWAPRRSPTLVPGSPRLLEQHGRRAAALLQASANADRLIAVSEFVKSVFVRHGIPPERITTLTPVPEVSDRLVRRTRETPVGPIRFGFLGRAVPVKGAHVFAEAARGIPRDKARFLIFGGATPETRRFLQELSGETHLEFRGPYTRDTLQTVLDEVDVVVVPSVVQETVGLVTLEAQAAGAPVIASRIGAIPEFVRDGEDGLLFRPGDPADLKEKLLRLIEAPWLVATLSAHTRPPMAMAEHVRRVLDIYSECQRHTERRTPV